MTAHVEELAALAASLPPGAVLAHVVTRCAAEVVDDHGHVHRADTPSYEVWTEEGTSDPWTGEETLGFTCGVCWECGDTFDLPAPPRAWAKIGDEPWRSVRSVEFLSHIDDNGERTDERAKLTVELVTDCGLRRRRSSYWVVTPSVTWEQPKGGLAGRHEVMGVVG